MVEPFGSDSATGTPNLDVQKFLGLTVLDIRTNSSWDSQGGDCTITLIQDDGETLENAIVGSPRYFEIIDKDQNPIFRFYGILDELSRNSSPNSKTYTATLRSPTLLLESCPVITEGFTGHGGAQEAYGPNISSKLDFGSNNSNVNASNMFNVFNVFGLYENSEYGAIPSALSVNGKTTGFGSSAITSDGISVNYFGYAIDHLVNGGAGSPELGGNILYGATTYNGVGDPSSAYAYNFDILGFLDQIKDFIPNDYRVTATDLMGFISEICDTINHVFYVDLLKPSGEGSQYFGDGHTSTKIPVLTHNNTIYGGQIVVITQNRNVTSPKKFPLAEYVVSKEISDKSSGSGQLADLPLDIGLSGSVHPDGPPVASAPFGGNYPTEEISVDDTERLKSSNLTVNLNKGASCSKFIVGGFQSRVNYIKSVNTDNVSPPGTWQAEGVDSDPSHDVYCYWGDINVQARNIATPNNPMQRNVPILTPLISPHVIQYSSQPNSNIRYMSDIVVVDCFDIFGRFTSDSSIGYPPVFEDGLYLASVGELEAAARSYPSWEDWMSTNKGSKLGRLSSIFPAAIRTRYRDFRGVGYTYLGKSVQSQANHWIGLYNTSSSSTGRKPICDTSELSGVAGGIAGVGFVAFTELLVQRLREIYDTHYGKTYAVKMPAYSLRSNPEYTPGEVQDYVIPSWDISQDGYLDPSKWDEYQTPQGEFLSNGRIKAYANFETNSSTVREIHCNNYIDYVPDSRVWSPTNQTRFFKKFTEYSNNTYTRPVSYDGVFNVVSVPITVREDYVSLPSAYFSIYSPHTAIQPGFKTFAQSIDIDSEMGNVRPFLLGLELSYLDAGGVPFAVVELQNRVYSPLADINQMEESPTCSFGDEPNDARRLKQYKKSLNSAANTNEVTSNSTPFVSHPSGFGIPQESTRYVYGPWITQTSLAYGAKVEYEQIEELRPENYMSYDTMNTVGQLRANSVENFDFLYVEQASIAIPGLPKITNIGLSLIENGPLVSDISFSLSANEVTTNYGMKTFAPKFGRIGKYYADRITKLTSRLKG